MQRHFEIELEELQVAFWRWDSSFSGRSSSVLNHYMAMLDGSAEATTEVIEQIEPRVDELHREIDQRALGSSALQQVMAVDLRFVTAATRIGSDLERMSDRAVNIARRAISVLTSSESEIGGPDPQNGGNRRSHGPGLHGCI